MHNWGVYIPVIETWSISSEGHQRLWAGHCGDLRDATAAGDSPFAMVGPGEPKNRPNGTKGSATKTRDWTISNEENGGNTRILRWWWWWWWWWWVIIVVTEQFRLELRCWSIFAAALYPSGPRSQWKGFHVVFLWSILVDHGRSGIDKHQLADSRLTDAGGVRPLSQHWQGPGHFSWSLTSQAQSGFDGIWLLDVIGVFEIGWMGLFNTIQLLEATHELQVAILDSWKCHWSTFSAWCVSFQTVSHSFGCAARSGLDFTLVGTGRNPQLGRPNWFQPADHHFSTFQCLVVEGSPSFDAQF